MWLVRPAQPDDLKQILAIAGTQGARLSSTLPKESDALKQKIELSVASFKGQVPEGQAPRFLFVLENSEDGAIAGVAGIDARAGSGEPFYSYRKDALIHASHELGVSRKVEVLYPSHALTDQTLLCSFVIRPELRGTEAFDLLSRARILFIAEHREWFTSRVVVEIQGVQNDDGGVPFWDSLGRHFFNMDFDAADRYSASLSKTFLAEMMPHNPIYVSLLSDAAQAALGKPHDVSSANYELLTREGFQAGCYLDIFDGGPVLEARTDSLHSLVTSHRKVLHGRHEDDGEACLISAGEGESFRCTLTWVDESLEDELKVPVKTWNLLGKSAGDAVRIAPL
ncbi:arginine N-succinyltransferase [Marinobacter salinisoli]|uniref:Arginine N-succinyltransferase n=1 Tax=Marinobacter salinisoli TaxID=2769486 RepID=A0ABX7MV99_9GAMM|nr:arginine N-succinyltransferase [Marinobacter salinisoli]QSP95021.1 arginine N-succinyltransferase [Marinobacter salinisoli]